MIFSIIESEGGYKEASAVTQDCLEICCNVLDGSDITQRLFYGMGGGWHYRLMDFFSPATIEVLSRKPHGVSGGHEDGEDRDSTFLDFAQHGPWFEQTGRLKCAILALQSLSASLGESGAQHAAVKSSVEDIISSCAHWIIRSGPAEMLSTCLGILNALASGPEKAIALRMFSLVLRYIPSASGLHIRSGLSASPVHFSWKPSASDERRAVSFPNVLAERYLFPVQCWWGHEASTRSIRRLSGADSNAVYLVGNEFWMGALRVLESVLAADETASIMIMQNILAPPPPPSDFDEDSMSGQVDSMQMELGGLVLGILLNSLDRVVVHQGSTGTSVSTLQSDAALAIRAANLMALVLVHGGLLARELSTAICTVHLATQRAALDPTFKAQSSPSNVPMPILPHLLSVCSRVVRVAGVGFDVACAVLRMLAAAACKCERASIQVKNLLIRSLVRLIGNYFADA